jgi:hypothetical protein
MTNLEALIVVIDSHRKHFLGATLANDILIKDFKNIVGDGQLAFSIFATFVNLFTNDVITEVHTLITDENRRARDQFSHLVLAFTAKRAIQKLFVLILGSFVTHTKLPKFYVQSTR